MRSSGTAIRSWRRGLARSLAKRIGETLGKEDWRDTWQRGLGKRIGEKLGEEDLPVGDEGGGGGGAALILKSSNLHLADGEM